MEKNKQSSPQDSRSPSNMVTKRPSPLAALVARVDEEHAAAAATAGEGGAAPDMAERHKALVRAAGRASIEETLLNPERLGSELTAESLMQEWLAYAEVFGTNGMAAGGARSHLRDEDDARRTAVSNAAPLRHRTRLLVAAALVIVAVTVRLRRAS